VNNPAKEYYQAMFWGTVDATSGDPIIFDIFDVLAVRNPDGTIEPIGFSDAATPLPVTTERSQEAIQEDLDAAGIALQNAQKNYERNPYAGTKDALEKKTADIVTFGQEMTAAKRRDAAIEQRELRGSSGQAVLNGTPSLKTAEPPEYVIKGAYADLLTDSVKAFAFGSRPICTLEQYIDTRGADGTRTGFRAVGNKLEGKGAPYYVKIFDLNNDTVLPVDFSTDGLPCGPVGTDVRRNWEQRLLAFRRKVYTARHPFKA
jgi:hypothetical protein